MSINNYIKKNFKSILLSFAIIATLVIVGISIHALNLFTSEVDELKSYKINKVETFELKHSNIEIINIEIIPNCKDASNKVADALYVLSNNGNTPLNEIIVHIDMEDTVVADNFFSEWGIELQRVDNAKQLYYFALSTPLQIGQQLNIRFEVFTKQTDQKTVELV